LNKCLNLYKNPDKKLKKHWKKNMNKWQIIIIVLVLLGSAGYWFAAMPATATPSGIESQARFTAGTYKVITDDFKAVDETRKTDANNDFPGRDVRVLKGKVWRPEGLQTPGPLVVYSHGFMSFHQEGQYLTRFLASHGYTVVSVDYPLTNFFAPGKPKLADVVNQPGDVSFLIDTMLKRNSDKSDALFNTIDPKKIAVDGVSLGGMTSTLVAFHGKVFDKRITAAISTAGPASMFTASFFASNNIPFMMIGGDGDAMVSYEKNAANIPQKKPGSILVTLKNASHAGFAQPASTFMRFMGNPDSLGCQQLTKNLPAANSNKSDSFIPGLDGAEYGIDLSDRTMPCSGNIPASAMKASRQHMFTTLAVYSFLDSIFASEMAMRNASREYLLHTLPAENSAEVSVTQ
jgi:predicted dienelactone hydrolase